MRECHINTFSETLSPPEIPVLMQRCLKAEEDRNMSRNSMKELYRYLSEFSDFCQDRGIESVVELTPSLLKDYADCRCIDAGPATKKAVIWALRKFGRFLTLLQLVQDDPARKLRHPKMHPRAELPTYLSGKQLGTLLKHAASQREYRDFAIISLMASTGLRPKEMAMLQRNDVHLGARRLDVPVKGGWVKKTPLSNSIFFILSRHLASRDDTHSALFLTARGRAVSVSWLQRQIKVIGGEAGLPFSLTCNHLRHSFATHAADRHGKVITKALMGHQRLTTTEIYTHLSPRHFQSLAQLHPYQLPLNKGGSDE